jgi:hypothetical protein
MASIRAGCAGLVGGALGEGLQNCTERLDGLLGIRLLLAGGGNGFVWGLHL